MHADFLGFYLDFGGFAPADQDQLPQDVWGTENERDVFIFCLEISSPKAKKSADIFAVLGNDAGVFCAFKRNTHF